MGSGPGYWSSSGLLLLSGVLFLLPPEWLLLLLLWLDSLKQSASLEPLARNGLMVLLNECICQWKELLLQTVRPVGNSSSQKVTARIRPAVSMMMVMNSLLTACASRKDEWECRAACIVERICGTQRMQKNADGLDDE